MGNAGSTLQFGEDEHDGFDDDVVEFSSQAPSSDVFITDGEDDRGMEGSDFAA